LASERVFFFTMMHDFACQTLARRNAKNEEELEELLYVQACIALVVPGGTRKKF
jgi:hypothetical protein